MSEKIQIDIIDEFQDSDFLNREDILSAIGMIKGVLRVDGIPFQGPDLITSPSPVPASESELHLVETASAPGVEKVPDWKAATTNVSTCPVVCTSPYDSSVNDLAIQARAGLAEHLNWAASYSDGCKQSLREAQEYFAKKSGWLESVVMPDTLVNINPPGLMISPQTITVPWIVKDFAEKLDQAKYIKILAALLGEPRIQRLHNCMLKSNQQHTPALWLNQAIYIELEKEAMRDLIQKAKPDKRLTPKLLVEIQRYFLEIFGNELQGRFYGASSIGDISIYEILLLIVDKILVDREVKPPKPLFMHQADEVPQEDPEVVRLREFGNSLKQQIEDDPFQPFGE